MDNTTIQERWKTIDATLRSAYDAEEVEIMQAENCLLGRIKGIWEIFGIMIKVIIEIIIKGLNNILRVKYKENKDGDK